MGWTQQVTVTVGTTDHTAEAIDSVFITRGRHSYWEGLQAGIARIVLLDPAVRPAIGQTASVDVDLNAGGTTRVFQGRVQNIAAQLDPTIGTVLTIDAFGPLARAGRRDQTETLSAELDGIRILNLLENALNEQWAEQPLTQTWGDVPASRTWADYGIDTSLIDEGLYEVAPLTSVPTNTLAALARTAFSGGGFVYETGDGKVGYADSTARQGASLGTPTSVDANDVFALSGVSTEAFDDIVNQANVEWSGGTVTFTATDSVAQYGYVVRDYLTILNDSDDATEFTERLVRLQANPAPDLEGPLAIRLNNVTDSLADGLLQLAINDYLEVTSVPTGVLPAGLFRGFVEGVNLELTSTFANVEVFASDESYSIYETRWADVPDTLTWGSVDATLTWQNA